LAEIGFWCPASRTGGWRGEAGEGSTLFFEFATMAALEVDGEEGEQDKANDDYGDHEDPAPVCGDP